jgi:hypothetical protein
MDYYAGNLKRLPELDAIKQWLDQGNKHDFLESVFKQASKWFLSDKQVAAVKKVWGMQTGTVGPTQYIEFDENRKEAVLLLIRYASQYARNTYEMYQSFASQVQSKSKMTAKQYETLINKAHKYKRAIFKRAFGDQ